jgi:hypothetical protein
MFFTFSIYSEGGKCCSGPCAGSIHTHTHTRIISNRVWVANMVNTCATSDEKSVVSVASRMLLRLKESVKVPERGFDPTIGAHLLKAELEEDLAILGASLEQRVETAAGRPHAQPAHVVRLPFRRSPRSTTPLASASSLASPPPSLARSPHLLIMSSVRSTASVGGFTVNFSPFVT